MKKKIIIVVFILILITLSIYYTYTIDVNINNTVGNADLTYNIDINDTTGRSITVKSNSTKIFNIFITNNNGVKIKYGLAYNVEKEDNITIAQVDRSKNKVSDLIDGLISITYSNDKWGKADSNNANNDWYNYNEKKWANAVLVTNTYRTIYQNATVGTEIEEDDILAYYVWIPRYKYKVWI